MNITDLSYDALKARAVEDGKKLAELEEAHLTRVSLTLDAMAGDMLGEYAEGKTPDAENYRTSLWEVFDTMYEQVADYFGNSLLMGLDEAAETDEDLAEWARLRAEGQEELTAIMRAQLGSRAEIQIGYILNTTNEIFQRQAGAAVDRQGESATRQSVADEIGAQFKRRMLNRAVTITANEVHHTAAAAVFIEGAFTAGREYRVDQPGQFRPGVTTKRFLKTWVTMRDERVRFSHQAVDGQSVLLHEAFVVNRESLLFPGDTSLGASENNVVGCRCWLTLSVQ